MKGNEINTKLNGLYQQMSKSKGVMLWTIIFTPFFLRVSLGVSWAFILVMISGMLALSALFFYRLSILKRATEANDNFVAIDQLIRLFKKWKTVGTLFGWSFLIVLVVWLYLERPEKLNDEFFIWGLLSGALVGGVIVIVRERKTSKELKNICVSIEQQMKM